MRIRVTLDDELVRLAGELTGISDQATLVRQGLKELAERESCRRLAALGGTMPWLKDVPRRRWSPGAPD